MEEKSKKLTSGGRNLVILGVVSTLVALATTGVSLMIYHNSGDIYLDRSRPGYLPDEEEIEQDDAKEQEVVYDFTKVENLTQESLEEYLKNLNAEIEAVNAYKAPFDAEIMSDEHFGIPKE